MSTSISNEQRLRAIHADSPGEPANQPRRAPMIRWTRVVAVLTGAAGVAVATVEAATATYLHLNPVAGMLFMLSGLAVSVLCIEEMLADRQEFYRRGQLDGWMKGWRGQEPGVDDPLLRR